MNTTTTIRPATDRQIRTWLQGEIQDSLQRGGVWRLERPLHGAIAELAAAGDSDGLERAREAHRLIHEADRALSWRDWTQARWSMTAAHNMSARLHAIPARMELDRQLQIMDDAIEAATLQPWSAAWRAWIGPEYCTILIEQPQYGPWLRETLEAWERGDPITIEHGRLATL